MGVIDGQPVSAAVTNPAFINKNIDDSTPSKLGLANADPISGTAVTNSQREFNSISSFTGSVLNSIKTQLPVWINNGIGTPTDNLKDRIEALTGAGTYIRAGSTAITVGGTSLTVVFSSALASTNYAAVCTMSNLTDTFPQFQPITVTAKTTTGFTAMWDQAADSSNYLLDYTALINV